MAKDPVCGMDVDESTVRHTAQHDGQAYYFCAPGCKKAHSMPTRGNISTRATIPT